MQEPQAQLFIDTGIRLAQLTFMFSIWHQIHILQISPQKHVLEHNIKISI